LLLFCFLFKHQSADEQKQLEESEWGASSGNNKARKTEEGYKIRWLKFTNKPKERGTKRNDYARFTQQNVVAKGTNLPSACLFLPCTHQLWRSQVQMSIWVESAMDW